MTEIDNLQDELSKKKYIELQNQELYEINKEIKAENMELRKDVSDFDRLKAEMKRLEKTHRHEIIELKEKNSEL